jgi:6-phosphogluconolactonase/glucosamine-6-phosphate isomerase/deaminase
VANSAAEAIAALARETIEARVKFLFAVSGGHTRSVMLHALVAAQIPWPAVRYFRSTSV